MSKSCLGQSRKNLAYSGLDEPQIIGVKETGPIELVPDTGFSGKETMIVKLGLCLQNVQYIEWELLASTSVKLHEQWDHLV